MIPGLVSMQRTSFRLRKKASGFSTISVVILQTWTTLLETQRSTRCKMGLSFKRQSTIYLINTFFR